MASEVGDAVHRLLEQVEPAAPAVPDLEQVRQLIRAFTTRAREDLDQRLKKWPLDFAKRDVHEVVGALLARQVTLASQPLSLTAARAAWTQPFP